MTNLDTALESQEENFYKMPGGTLFHYYDMYYKITGKKAKTGKYLVNLHNALKNINSKSRTVGKAVIKKYNHLL